MPRKRNTVQRLSEAAQNGTKPDHDINFVKRSYTIRDDQVDKFKAIQGMLLSQGINVTHAHLLRYALDQLFDRMMDKDGNPGRALNKILSDLWDLEEFETDGNPNRSHSRSDGLREYVEGL